MTFRLTNSLVYYGLSLNTGTLSGNIFVNSFISAAVEVPANIICIFTMLYLGRKPTLVGAFLIAGVSAFLCIPFLDNDGKSVIRMSDIIFNIFIVLVSVKYFILSLLLFINISYMHQILCFSQI